MRGLLKTKSAGTQLLLIISLALVSFFMIGGIVSAFIVPSLVGLDPLVVSKPENWDFSKPAYATLLRLLQFVQFITLFVIPAYVGARLFSINSKQYLGFKKPWSPVYFLAGAGMLLLSLPLVEWLGQLNQQIPFPSSWIKWMQDKEDGANVMIKGLLSRHSISDLLLNIVFIAVLAAVGEELLFRGILQRLFIKLFKNHWVGIIVAAFLFSAIHMQFFGFLPRFALGIVLGMVYWYSGSLWVAMAAHFMYDATLIVVAYYIPGKMDVEQSANIPNIPVYAGISLVIVSVITAWMIRSSRTRYRDIYGEDAIPVKDNPF